MRSAIVFLHTSLETTLREIVRLKLKNNADISYIPLSEQSGFPNRNEKFTLKDLTKHRGKTVDHVIDESIDEYLNSLSFNSSKDIANTFTKIGMPQETLRQFYSSLDGMIARRHRIVHEGDLIRERRTSELEPIEVEKYGEWADATSEFCAEAIRLIINSIYLDIIMVRFAKNGIQLTRDEVEKSINVEVLSGNVDPGRIPLHR